jgi:hypothetical protein
MVVVSATLDSPVMDALGPVYGGAEEHAANWEMRIKGATRLRISAFCVA